MTDTATRVALSEDRPIPETRPRGRLLMALPLVLAGVLGVAAGVTPAATALVVGAVVSAVVLVPRLEWAALAVVGTAVFEDYLDLLSSWATEWLAAVLLLAWAVRRVRGPLHTHRNLHVRVPAAVFAVVLLASALLHPNGQAGAEVCARYGGLLLVMLVLAETMSGPLRPSRAARVYVWSCVVAALCGIATALLGDEGLVAGPLANPNALAFFLLGSLPLLGSLQTRRDWLTWPSWVAFAVIMVAIIGTQSRGVFIAWGVTVVLAVLTGVLAARIAGVLLVLVATGATLVLAVLTVLPQPIGETLTDQQRYAETRLTQRIDLWRSAVAMTRESPVLGLGPGAFALSHQDFQDYGDDDIDPADWDPGTAHSTVLEASAELGVLGAAALMAVYVVPAAATRRRWRQGRLTMTAATWLALAGLLTASLFATEQYGLPLWFLAALSAAVGNEARPRFPLRHDDSSGQVVVGS